MRLDRFFLFTGAGAGIWCAALLAVGWLIGKAEASLTQEQLRTLMRDYAHRAVLWMVPFVIAIVAGYVILLRSRRAAGAQREQGTAGAGGGEGEAGNDPGS